MSETFEQAVDEVYEEAQQEKTGFVKNAKNAIAGKLANFKEDHPTLAKVGKTTVKVIEVAGLIGLGLFAGNAIAHKDEDYPGFDDSDMSEVETE